MKGYAREQPNHRFVANRTSGPAWNVLKKCVSGEVSEVPGAGRSERSADRLGDVAREHGYRGVIVVGKGPELIGRDLEPLAVRHFFYSMER